MNVSVVIPVYNRCQVCLSAIRSVFRQTVEGVELIVVDDGSSMDMTAVRREVTEGGGRFIEAEHRGAAAARNIGAAEARGRWLAFLDSDDTWLPEKLEVQLELHEQQPELLISQTEELWYRRGERVNQREVHAKPNGEAFARSLELCCISPSAVLLDRQVFEESGGFDEAMVVCEDYDLWLRLTTRYRVGLVELPLVEKFGGHADQLSRSEPAMDRFRLYSIIKLLQSELPSDEQRILAQQMLKKKAKVLLTGAKKRRNKPFSELLKATLQIAAEAGPNASHVIWQRFEQRENYLSRDIVSEVSEYEQLRQQG